MTKNAKLTVVPTILSSKETLWCVLFVGYFAAICWAYTIYGHIVEAREELKKPVVTRVEADLFSVTVPTGWREYAVSNNFVEIRRTSDHSIPFVQVFAVQNPAYAYSALDTSPAIVLRRYEHLFVHSGGTSAQLRGLDRDVDLIRPGVPAIRQLVKIGDTHSAQAAYFFSGDVRYVYFAVWENKDADAQREIEMHFSHLGELMHFDVRRESISREIINSLDISSQQYRETRESVERELALWRLFRGRAKAQPEAYLLPSIQHFREALRLLSTICEEDGLIASEDFKEYLIFLGRRQQLVREWFVRLDKLIGMKNVEAAKVQAKYIIEHATLVDESLDKRHASEILSGLVPPTSAQ